MQKNGTVSAAEFKGKGFLLGPIYTDQKPHDKLLSYYTMFGWINAWDGMGGKRRGVKGRGEVKKRGGEGMDGWDILYNISRCCDNCLTFNSLLWAIRLIQLHS